MPPRVRVTATGGKASVKMGDRTWEVGEASEAPDGGAGGYADPGPDPGAAAGGGAAWGGGVAAAPALAWGFLERHGWTAVFVLALYWVWLHPHVRRALGAARDAVRDERGRVARLDQAQWRARERQQQRLAQQQDAAKDEAGRGPAGGDPRDRAERKLAELDAKAARLGLRPRGQTTGTGGGGGGGGGGGYNPLNPGGGSARYRATRRTPPGGGG